MTAADRLNEIEARANAATEGPWGWFGNTDVRTIYLATRHNGRKFVMRFKRWGMQGAQPMFRDDPGPRGIMVPASELAMYEVARDATSRDDDRVYRADLVAIRNPDAEFIAHARTDVPALVAALRAVLKLADHVEELYDELPKPHGPRTEGYSLAIRDFRRAIEEALS